MKSTQASKYLCVGETVVNDMVKCDAVFGGKLRPTTANQRWSNDGLETSGLVFCFGHQVSVILAADFASIDRVGSLCCSATRVSEAEPLRREMAVDAQGKAASLSLPRSPGGG